jgi:hypothetical protein
MVFLFQPVPTARQQQNGKKTVNPLAGGHAVFLSEQTYSLD